MADARVEFEIAADTSQAVKSIGKVGDEAEKAGSEAESAGSGSFKNVEKGARSASGEADDLGSAAKQAGDDAESAGGGAFDGVVSGAEEAKSSIDGMQAALGAVGGALTLSGIVGTMGDLAAQAAESNAVMSRLEASAQSNNVSTEAMNGTYSKLIGVLGDTDRVVETSGNLFALCGDNQERLQTMTTALTGAYSQFGDGMPIEALAEAANETAKVGTVTGSFADALNWVNASTDQWSAGLASNSVAQARFLACVDAGMSKEDAYNEALGACTTEQERQQLVVDTLNSLYGEQGAAYEDANADAIAYRQAQDDLGTAMTELGEKAMPIVTDATEAATDALGWLIDNGPSLAPIISGIVAAILGFTAIQTAIGFIQGLVVAFTVASGPILAIVGVIAVVVAAIVALATNAGGCRDMVVDAFNGVVEFVSGLPDAIGAFLSDLLSRAVEWASGMAEEATEAGSEFLDNVVSFVTQLPGQVAGFLSSILSNAASWVSSMASQAVSAGSQFLGNVVSFVTQLPGRIAGFLSSILSNAASWVGTMASKATQAGYQFLSNVVSFVTQLPGRVAGFLSSVISNAASWVGGMASQAVSAGSQFLGNVVSFVTQLPGNVAGLLSSVISNVAGFAGQMASGALSAGQQFLSNIVNTLASIPGRVASIGSNIVQGIINGITGAAGRLTRTLVNMANDALGGVLSFLGIASPSKVFRDKVGRWIPLGAAEGVEDEGDAYQRAVDSVFAYRPSVDAEALWAPSIAAPQQAPVQQTVNFFQPAQSPDEIARTYRMNGLYGLGAVM